MKSDYTTVGIGLSFGGWIVNEHRYCGGWEIWHRDKKLRGMTPHRQRNV